MDDGRIPKDLLYGELKLGVRGKGRPQLRYKDVCKRDMKALEIDETSWEGVASDRVAWRRTLRSQLVHGEGKLKADAAAKRARRKERNQLKADGVPQNQSSSFICEYCGRDCKARIGLHSHRKSCSNRV